MNRFTKINERISKRENEAKTIVKELQDFTRGLRTQMRYILHEGNDESNPELTEDAAPHNGFAHVFAQLKLEFEGHTFVYNLKYSHVGEHKYEIACGDGVPRKLDLSQAGMDSSVARKVAEELVDWTEKLVTQTSPCEPLPSEVDWPTGSDQREQAFGKVLDAN
jgi:hypothetical protein